MNALLFALGVALLPAPPDRMVGSVWLRKVADGCVDRLTFRAKYKVVEYGCEQQYASQVTYALRQSTLTLLVRDDSHAEDGGQPILYRTTYRLTGSRTLHLLRLEEFINRSWRNVPQERRTVFTRAR